MKAIKAFFVIAVIGFLFAGALFAWGWNDLSTPVEHQMAGKTVNIPTGSSIEQIVQKLQTDGIVAHGATLKLYIKLQGVGSMIKAGDYQFQSPISPRDVVQKLLEGGAAGNKLTIIEGWTRWDIAHAMAAIPSLKLKNADQALALMTDTTSIRDLDPSATSLEGYMFPDTYFVQSTTTAKQLLESSVEHFHQVWNKDLANLALARKQSPHDVVTVASIIETEAKLASERPVVASVIYNRLRQHIPLSVDSTIVYASKLAGKWRNNGIVYLSDVNRESPYNTRKVTGLPPGPVSNPGLSSLKAALEPANTGFIYYVREPSRNDGAHNFYVDAAGFETGVQALRNWEKVHRGNTSAHAAPSTGTSSATQPQTNATASLKTMRAIPGSHQTTETKPESSNNSKPTSANQSSASPSVSAKPAAAAKPGVSAKPAASTKPAASIKPAASAKPATSAKPSAPKSIKPSQAKSTHAKPQAKAASAKSSHGKGKSTGPAKHVPTNQKKSARHHR
ncbi:MAG TPA: endolytic transglycosylase MltG [Drouetiella sp.]